MDIERIIKIVRYIKEEGMVGAIGAMPTMNTGSVPEAPGFSGAADPRGPSAGFDPLLGKRKRKNGGIDFRRVAPNYKKWVKNIEDNKK